MRLKRTVIEVGGIVLVAGVAAAVTSQVHPEAPAWFLKEEFAKDEISLEQVRERFGEAEILWVDARKTKAFESGHLEGAVLLNEEGWADQLWDNRERFDSLDGRPVIVYCDGKRCRRSREVADRLRQEMGLEPVFVLRGEWRDWRID